MKNILITGMPKSGKTTLLNKIIKKFNHKIGFVTNEVLDKKGKNRTAFEMVTNNGYKKILADKNLDSKFKVGKYGVNVEYLNIILEQIKIYNKKELLYIDEIGEMELFSEEFKNLVLDYLNSSNTFIGTISKIYNDKFLEEIKRRNDVVIFELNKNNRLKIEKKLKSIFGSF